MNKETDNLKIESWKAYASSLERQLNQIQINLRPPVVRIKALADVLRMGEIDSKEEKLEMIAAISQEAEEAMGFLIELSLELDRKKGTEGGNS